ncbi:fatty acid binding protein 1-B.1-like [Glandiceps talaboti]
MAQFVGSWKLEKQEGAEELVKGMDAPEDIKEKFLAMKPTTVITKTGNTFIFDVEVDSMKYQHKVPLGEEFETTNHMTGEKSKAIAKMEGNKLVIKDVLDTPKSVSSVSEVIDGKYVITVIAKNGVASKHFYVKA